MFYELIDPASASGVVQWGCGRDRDDRHGRPGSSTPSRLFVSPVDEMRVALSERYVGATDGTEFDSVSAARASGGERGPEPEDVGLEIDPESDLPDAWA